MKSEYERNARDTLAELYRERILQKNYGADDLQKYFKDWQDLEKAFFERFNNFNSNNMASRGSSGSGFGINEATDSALYELWSRFSLDKVMEGALRISRS